MQDSRAGNRQYFVSGDFGVRHLGSQVRTDPSGQARKQICGRTLPPCGLLGGQSHHNEALEHPVCLRSQKRQRSQYVLRAFSDLQEWPDRQNSADQERPQDLEKSKCLLSLTPVVDFGAQVPGNER